MIDLRLGDCLDVMRSMEAASVDAVVTDPPAGIGFMGKTWDKPGVLGVSGGKAMPATMASRNPICRSCRKHVRGKPPRPTCSCPTPDSDVMTGVAHERGLFVAYLAERMAEARRVSRPGSHALVWALPRTSHWTALALEDAGWVIRDRVSHLFGTGFPKSKACLKPACEDWWLAWNPAKKVTPLNIDGCRVETAESTVRNTTGARSGHSMNCAHDGSLSKAGVYGTDSGRWPANVTHDGSPDVMEAFAAFGETKRPNGRPNCAGAVYTKNAQVYGDYQPFAYDGGSPDPGTAARFFYCAKASRKDRNEGLEGMPEVLVQSVALGDKKHGTLPYTNEPREQKPLPRANTHPTVKNTQLMRWLCRLITPPGGTVLDPFAGSGSTGKACAAEGFNFIGIEQSPEYHAIARRRIAAALKVKAAS